MQKSFMQTNQALKRITLALMATLSKVSVYMEKYSVYMEKYLVSISVERA